jgi:inorganic triphosphatase YgiF
VVDEDPGTSPGQAPPRTSVAGAVFCSVSRNSLFFSFDVVPPMGVLYLDMANTGSLEIEIKIQLESFTDYLKLLGYLGPIDREEHHHNAFFDSPQKELLGAGYVLRVRSTDRAGSITLKSAGTQRDNLAIREETIGEVGSVLARRIIDGHADLMALETEPVQMVRRMFPELKPQLMLQFRNERHVKRYRLGECDIELEIDKTEFADGSNEYEIEVELGDLDQFEPVNACLLKLLQTLSIPYIGQTRSKFERALTRG